jgi:hypothetical protein
MGVFDVTNDGSRLFPSTAFVKFMTPQDSLLRIKAQSMYVLLPAVHRVKWFIS